MFEVRPEGMDELVRALGRYPEIAGQEVRKAMQQSVILVESNVKPFAPVGVSSRLRNSIGSEITGAGVNIVGKVGSSMTDEKYPAVMELGLDPGTFPPPGNLERWVHLQLGVPDDQAPGVAFLVARSIARKGIAARRYLQQGWQKSVGQVNQFFEAALRRIVERISRGG